MLARWTQLQEIRKVLRLQLLLLGISYHSMYTRSLDAFLIKLSSAQPTVSAAAYMVYVLMCVWHFLVATEHEEKLRKFKERYVLEEDLK